MNKTQALMAVAEAALRDIEQQPPAKRAEIYFGLSLILPDKEAREHARHAAVMLGEAERAQLKLKELFS